MVVKSVRGRRRYVAFEVPAGTGRDSLSAALSGLEGTVGQLKPISCSDDGAVVRCSPEGVDAVISAVQEGIPGSRPLQTSGTLRTIRDRHPGLRTPRKRKK